MGNKLQIELLTIKYEKAKKEWLENVRLNYSSLIPDCEQKVTELAKEIDALHNDDSDEINSLKARIGRLEKFAENSIQNLSEKLSTSMGENRTILDEMNALVKLIEMEAPPPHGGSLVVIHGKATEIRDKLRGY